MRDSPVWRHSGGYYVPTLDFDHVMRVASASLLLIGLLCLSACGSKSEFVKLSSSPVSAEQTQADRQQYEDGYLRIFVSSNLDSNGRAIDFGKEKERPALLLISARFGRGTVASFAADVDPEIPVLLYDVQAGKTMSSVVSNALLTEGMLVDPASLSKSPHLQIFVRGVPADKARWVTNLLEIATAEPALKMGMSLIPGASVAAGLSTKLGDMLSDEIKTTNKPWEEKTLLGLRADQGLFSLDGRQFVVLLNSTTMELQAPPQLSRCDVKKSPTGLCLPNGDPWVPAQAYVRFELDVTDFRSIKDFIGVAVSCEAEERVWNEYRALLASGQIATKQLEYERHIMARGELLMAARRAQAEYTGPRYTSRLLEFAQRYALLPTPSEADPYWREHFAHRAQPLDACIRTVAVRGQSQSAAIWESTTALFTQSRAYPAWAAALVDNDDAQLPVLRDAEATLKRLNQLRTMGDIRNLDAQSLESLDNLSHQLVQMLLPSYERIAENIAGGLAPLPERIAGLGTLAARTACAPCAAALTDMAAVLQQQIVELPPPEIVDAPPPLIPAGGSIPSDAAVPAVPVAAPQPTPAAVPVPTPTPTPATEKKPSKKTKAQPQPQASPQP